MDGPLRPMVNVNVLLLKLNFILEEKIFGVLTRRAVLSGKHDDLFHDTILTISQSILFLHCTN